jgi:hypothetical protein
MQVVGARPGTSRCHDLELARQVYYPRRSQVNNTTAPCYGSAVRMELVPIRSMVL